MVCKEMGERPDAETVRHQLDQIDFSFLKADDNDETTLQEIDTSGIMDRWLFQPLLLIKDKFVRHNKWNVVVFDSLNIFLYYFSLPCELIFTTFTIINYWH